MPDELKRTHSPSASEIANDGLPSELELLISEAEQPKQPRPQQVECSHTGTLPFERKHCKTCGHLICPVCWSVLDPDFCRSCLSEADTKLIQDKLVDDEGVEHTGRVLHPDPEARFYQPKFGTLAKSIAEMPDGELETYIGHYEVLVKQAERALDFRTINLGSAKLERAQRADAKRRALRGYKVTASKTLVIGKDGKPAKQGVSMDQMLSMLAMLQKLRENREKKS